MSFKIFRGASAVSASLLILFLAITNLGLENEGQVNMFFGLTNSSLLGQSDYASVEEMRIAERANEVQTQEEGSVLFFNNDNALPLSSSSSVTLLGRSAASNIFRGSSGGSETNDDSAISLYEAMKEEGFAINDTVYNALAAAPNTRGRGSIGEVDVSFYTDDLRSSFASYSDAAIIVLSRLAGEQMDLAAGGASEQDVVVNENGDPIDNEGVPMLSLHQSERDLITMAKDAGFDRVITILNTGNPMDIGELESLGVDACLWVGYPGYTGFEGVANILSGSADPSGRTVDTYATDSLSAPAMRNYGTFHWSNYTALGKNSYIIYAEDIYVGYKYYETRYQDQVLGLNNATSTKGVYASDGNWDYAAEMAYPFGYGTSYASFTETLESLEWNKETHQVTATVKVRNEGVSSGSSYQGASKDVVELYVQLPYAAGQAEKSAIQLIGYGKTRALNAEEEDTVTIVVDDYIFATYDENAANGAHASKKGCYVFDPGDYYFAIGTDCHDALNNVLAARGVNGLFDHKGNAVDGNVALTHKDSLASIDNLTYALSETGEVVSNHFADKDINYYQAGTVSYLTRADWNTYPTRYENLEATEEMQTIIDGHLYEKPEDAPEISSFKYSQEYEEVIKLAELKGVAYEDDEKWDEFIDQLTPSELASICGEAFGNDAIERLGVPSTVNADGPDGIQNQAGFSHVCESLAASTYNDDLLEARGKFLAEDGMACGQVGVYGFGANLHRTPYSGRNFEYYSEDPILSYLMGAVQTKAAQDKGLITYVKHFCANDQEAARSGYAVFMTEQTYRQGPLKGFEGSFTKGGSLGTMTGNGRVGLDVVAQDYETMTIVLRQEWGFKGVAMTDSSRGSTHYIYTEESVAAGIDQFNNDTTRGTTDMRNLLIKERDGFMWQRAREIAKHYFYMLTRSFALADFTSETAVITVTPWWQTTLWSIVGALGSLAIIFAGVAAWRYIAEGKKMKKKED